MLSPKCDEEKGAPTNLSSSAVVGFVVLASAEGDEGATVAPTVHAPHLTSACMGVVEAIRHTQEGVMQTFWKFTDKYWAAAVAETNKKLSFFQLNHRSKGFDFVNVPQSKSKVKVRLQKNKDVCLLMSFSPTLL